MIFRLLLGCARPATSCEASCGPMVVHVGSGFAPGGSGGADEGGGGGIAGGGTAGGGTSGSTSGSKPQCIGPCQALIRHRHDQLLEAEVCGVGKAGAVAIPGADKELMQECRSALSREIKLDSPLLHLASAGAAVIAVVALLLFVLGQSWTRTRTESTSSGVDQHWKTSGERKVIVQFAPADLPERLRAFLRIAPPVTVLLLAVALIGLIVFAFWS